MSDFELTDADKKNPLWLRLREHFEKKLAVLRAKNDGDLDANQTATLRGQIKSFKNIIALGDERPIVDRE